MFRTRPASGSNNNIEEGKSAVSPSLGSPGAGGLYYTKTGVFDASGKALPELDYFRKQRRLQEMKQSLALQIAEHQTAGRRSALVKSAYIAAEDEMLRKAREAEMRKEVERQRKIEDDAAMVRSQLAERAAALKAAEEQQRKDDEILLALVAAKYEADMAKFKEARLREKEALMASKRENDELRILRAEADRVAAEEEKRLQREYTEKTLRAEQAHKDKYKHIGERQEHLAQLLMEATSVHREKMDGFYRRGEEEAERKAIADKAELERRKRANKQRILDGAAFVREQMREKAEAAQKAKDADLDLAELIDQEVLAGVARKKQVKVDDKKKKRTYYGVLSEQLREKETTLAQPPPLKYQVYASDQYRGTSLKLNTTSSDRDTETLFDLTSRMEQLAANVRGNRSDEIAPLLGFGAPFVTKIEEEGRAVPLQAQEPTRAFGDMKPRLAFEGQQPGCLLIKGSTIKPSALVAAASASPRKSR